MKLAIITHTPHWKEQGNHLAYGPYIREMNLWIKYANEIIVAAPMSGKERAKIHEPYNKNIEVGVLRGLSFKSFRESVRSLLMIPRNCYVICRVMREADHIHLRCPGNIGLLGSLMQILFPGKKKTVKYAGNWDPNSKQPLSYNVQKWILSNTSLTKNMQVLVYGEWPNTTTNVKPFFTASYDALQKGIIEKSITTPVRMVFVGSLVEGKRPSYAIKLVKELNRKGCETVLDIYGDGVLKDVLQEEQLKYVTYYGNQPADVITKAYKDAHFVILPSKSEGWPKVVAEGMFYGTVPLVTPISCVPWMLGEGTRGILLSLDLVKDIDQIIKVVEDTNQYNTLSTRAQKWSQDYTLDSFETAIKELLQ